MIVKHQQQQQQRGVGVEETQPLHDGKRVCGWSDLFVSTNAIPRVTNKKRCARPRSIYYVKGRQKKKIVQRDMTSIPIYPLVVGICLYTLIVLLFSLKRLYDKGAY